MGRPWVFGVIAWAVIGGCTASPKQSERTGSTAQPIQGGALDSANRYAMGICRSNSGQPGECAAICSGALILPNVVATARHCVSDSPLQINCSVDPTFGPAKGGTFYATTRVDMAAGGGSTGWYSVKSIQVPGDNHFCGNDLALLILNTPVPATDAKPITPGVQHLMWDPSLYGIVFTAIGYGNTSPNGTGSGMRRKLDFVSVLCVPGSEEMPCPASYNAKEFAGGDGTCSGDSGSSAFERRSFEAGNPVSFGVLSRGNDNKTDCVESAYTRFDAHRDFVVAVGRSASSNWTLYPEPSWTGPRRDPARRDAGATPPSGKALGDVCETEAECASNLCAETGDGKICSAACSAANPTSCGEGFECRDNLCLTPKAAAGAGAAPDDSGCGVGRDAGGGGHFPAALGFLLGVVSLAVARRRRLS